MTYIECPLARWYTNAAPTEDADFTHRYEMSCPALCGGHANRPAGRTGSGTLKTNCENRKDIITEEEPSH